MEYRMLSGTDLLFKRDPKSGEWQPIDAPEATQIAPCAPMPPNPTSNVKAVNEPSQSILAGFATLSAALDGQFYQGSHLDRARSFWVRTSLLTLLGIVSGMFYALVVKEAPVVSMTLFASIMLGLILAWLIAYLLDYLSSPETVTLFLALGLLGWLRRERRYRWERYENQ